MNILLIAPAPLNPHDPYFPMGIGYISSALKRAGYQVICANERLPSMSLDIRLEELSVSETSIDVIAIGGSPLSLAQIQECLLKARARFPSASVILGGNIVSCLGDKAMTVLDVDYGVLGEGEECVVDLMDALANRRPVSMVTGLVMRDRRTGVIEKTPVRINDACLDDRAFPDYEGLGLEEHIRLEAALANPGYIDNFRPASICTGRSCPFNCTFCYHYEHNRHRGRSVENCFVEIDYLVNRFGVNFLTLNDDMLFSAKATERLHALCEQFRKRELQWVCQTRVTEVDEKTLAVMKKSGCRSICYGIENVADPILRSMKKGITREQIERTLAMTVNCGIGVNGNLIFGDPAETWETFMANISWYLCNRQYSLKPILLRILPGSEIYRRAVDRGLIQDEIEYAYNKTGSMKKYELNVTQLSNAEWRKMANMVREAFDVCQYYPGLIKSYSWLEEDSYAKGIDSYRIEAFCPHCSSLSLYGSLPVGEGDGYLSLCCRHCYQTYQIPNIRVWHENPGLPKRLFTTHYPPRILMESYLHHGGSAKILAEKTKTD